MLNSVVLFIYIYIYIIITMHTVLYLLRLSDRLFVEIWPALNITWSWIIRFSVFGLMTTVIAWTQYHCDKPVCPCYIDFFLSFRNAGMHCTRCVSSCHHGTIILKPFIETLAKQYFTFVITTHVYVLLQAVFNLSETFILCIQDLFI